MLASERQRLICEKLQRDGQVLVSELAVEFHVSDETIRRDINALNDANRLRKVHGGAIPVKDNHPEPSYKVRAVTNRDTKRKLGVYAASLIQDNDSVVFGAGVTTDEILSAIRNVSNVTLLITSVSALTTLLQKQLDGHFTGQIIFLGGQIDPEYSWAMGTMTNQLLETFSVDKCFISATSISCEGVHLYNLDDGIFCETAIRRSAQVYILGESSKFGKKTLYKICDLDAVHHLITDGDIPLTLSMKKALSQAGIQLHVVE